MNIHCFLALLLAGAASYLGLPGDAVGQPRSGYDDASPETRAMQDDDTANPGFLWVLQGEILWSAPAGSAQKSCAACHGDMRGVAARYPAYDAALGRPITLDGRIEQCRTQRQNAPPLDEESETRLALSAYVGLQSRGLPLEIGVPAEAKRYLEAGEALFTQRQGQLNLSCAQCHDALAGQRLAGSIIPQGHPNGYPEYRLEWQAMGSLTRRVRNCLTGVRAETLAADSAEMTNLAFFLAWRARGLRVETPAVRP
jgi:sulfur-oxidizing protein SoxA